MKPLPHLYEVTLTCDTNNTEVTTLNAPAIRVTAPSQFDGDDADWSPESLLVASVASCFSLTFQMITKAKDFSFRQLEVAVEGLLEREDHGRRFTGMLIEATLSIPDDANEEVASRLLNRAHDTCFVATAV